MNGALDEAAIRTLIPHAGGMCLWQRVESWDQQQLRARTATHRDPRHPLRDAQGLSSIHLIEYGAQAMAIHGALLMRSATPVPGFLAAVRDFAAAHERIDDVPDDLFVTAQRLMADHNGSIYTFIIEAGSLRLASGRVSVATRPQG